MLRTLRIGRAVAFGTRAGSVTVRKSQRAAHVVRGTAAFSVIAEGDLDPITSDWDSFIAWTREPGPSSWVHASNLDRRRFDELARGAGLSDHALERMLDEDGHGTVLEGARGAALTLQVPTVPDTGFPEVHRDRLLALITDRGLLTAMTGSLELQKSVVLAGAPTASSFSNLFISKDFKVMWSSMRDLSSSLMSATVSWSDFVSLRQIVEVLLVLQIDVVEFLVFRSASAPTRPWTCHRSRAAAEIRRRSRKVPRRRSSPSSWASSRRASSSNR